MGSDGQFRQSNRSTDTSQNQDEDYAADAHRMAETLPQAFPDIRPLDFSKQQTVFLTGASGFLGAFVLRDLLCRKDPIVNVIVHIRAKSSEAALERLEQSCKAYGVWSDSWSSRIRCVTGNLGERRLGLASDVWFKLEDTVDVVIHNGAQVHWVYPYSKLKGPNVQGTIDAIKLCSEGKSKYFAYVSSTSVLDTDHYVQLSAKIRKAGGSGISESDDLQGSSTGLGTGYGQSKWVSEYLVREAGRRGLKGAIIRPGYVLGDSVLGGRVARMLYRFSNANLIGSHKLG